MLNDTSLLYTKADNEPNGVPLVWVIDGQCLYDIPTSQTYADMFMSSDEVVDISEDYPDHDGITVRFIQNGTIIEELQTSEYFGSILLSEPLVLDLSDYQYGQYVISPHATFDGEKFTITNRDLTGYPAWHPSDPRFED